MKTQIDNDNPLIGNNDNYEQVKNKVEGPNPSSKDTSYVESKMITLIIIFIKCIEHTKEIIINNHYISKNYQFY